MRTLIPCFPISRFTTFWKLSAHLGLTAIIFFFIIEPIYYCNILFHPLGPCILQETVWVMLTWSAFLIKGEIESKRGLLSDSFILKNVHGSASPHVTHFHSHEKQQKDTSLGWNYVHLWETKIFNNNNKSPSTSPSSQPVIMRQFQWLCLAGDFSKRVRTVERHWPKRQDAERVNILNESILDLPSGPSSCHPFRLQSPSSLQRSFLNFAQMQSLPESCPWSAPAAYAFLVTSHTLSHTVSYHFLPHICRVWVHALWHPFLVGMPLRLGPRLIILVFPLPYHIKCSVYSRCSASAGAQWRFVELKSVLHLPQHITSWES